MNELCLMTNLSSGDVAAWAQAVVSTAAIAVGAGALVWQVKRQRKDALHTAWQAQHDLASSAAMLLAEAKTKLEVIHPISLNAWVMENHLKAGDYAAENWQGLVDELAELNLSGLSRPHISMSVRRARSAVVKVRESMDSLASQPAVLAWMHLGIFEREVTLALKHVDAALESIATVVDQLAARISGVRS